MRTLILFNLLLLGIGALKLLESVGTDAAGGRVPTGEDMVALDLSNAVAGVHHVGLTAPDPGRILHLEWTTQTAGAGVLGAMAVFEVVRETDDSVLCSATVPCSQAISGHVHVDCEGEILAGEHLDVRPAAPSACLLQPKGVLVVTFFWQ